MQLYKISPKILKLDCESQTTSTPSTEAGIQPLERVDVHWRASAGAAVWTYTGGRASAGVGWTYTGRAGRGDVVDGGRTLAAERWGGGCGRRASGGPSGGGGCVGVPRCGCGRRASGGASRGGAQPGRHRGGGVDGASAGALGRWMRAAGVGGCAGVGRGVPQCGPQPGRRRGGGWMGGRGGLRGLRV